jgi:hypothetical protein
MLAPDVPDLEDLNDDLTGAGATTAADQQTAPRQGWR